MKIYISRIMKDKLIGCDKDFSPNLTPLFRTTDYKLIEDTPRIIYASPYLVQTRYIEYHYFDTTKIYWYWQSALKNAMLLDKCKEEKSSDEIKLYGFPYDIEISDEIYPVMFDMDFKYYSKDQLLSLTFNVVEEKNRAYIEM